MPILLPCWHEMTFELLAKHPRWLTRLSRFQLLFYLSIAEKKKKLDSCLFIVHHYNVNANCTNSGLNFIHWFSFERKRQKKMPKFVACSFIPLSLFWIFWDKRFSNNSLYIRVINKDTKKVIVLILDFKYRQCFLFSDHRKRRFTDVHMYFLSGFSIFFFLTQRRKLVISLLVVKTNILDSSNICGMKPATIFFYW